MIQWTVRIEVSDHAVRRAVERLGWGDVQDIREEVRDALVADRVSASQPNWTRGNGQESLEREDIMYVWDRAGTHSWVLARNEAGTMVNVKTLLVDYDDRIGQAEDLKLRTGQVRR